MPIAVSDVIERVALLKRAGLDLQAGRIERAQALVVGGSQGMGDAGIGWRAMSRVLADDARQLGLRRHDDSTVLEHLKQSIEELHSWAERGGRAPATWPQIRSPLRRSTVPPRPAVTLTPDLEAQLEALQREVERDLAKREAQAVRLEQARARQASRDPVAGESKGGGRPSVDPVEAVIDSASRSVEQLADLLRIF